MKAYPIKQQIKKSVALIGLSLFAATSPLMAQSGSSSGSGYSGSSSGVNDRAPMHEPAGADYDRGSNWSWLGLLGLLGLFGLRRRTTADDNADVRRARTA